MAKDEEKEELPLDIHYDKIAEWLEVRGKLDKKEWPNAVKAVKSQVKSTVTASPPEIKSLLEGSTVDYFTVLKVMSMLEKAQTDAGQKTKSFFGGYTDETLKAWDEVAKAYQKGNVYLGDCSSILAQNTNYEIPTLKKVLDQSDKQVRDLKKKLGDHQVGAANSRAKFLQACKELDIDGGDGDGDVDEEMLRERLRATAVGVGPLLEMVATCLMHPTITSACDSYQAFLDYTLAQHCANGGTAITETPGHTSRPIAATLRQLLSEAEGGAFAMAERLEDPSMRQGLMTDLLELEAFLKQRIVDRKAQGAMVQVLSSAPSAVLAHDQKVESYLEKVQATISAQRSERLQQLLMVRKSEPYVNRILLSVTQHVHTARRFEANRVGQEARLQELADTIAAGRAKLAAFTTGTRELKEKLEEALSQEYSGRKVNIFGHSAAF